jgi:anti-sigma B factor antagonist
MEIQERQQEGVTILDLKGRLLIGEGDVMLREKVNSLVDSGQTRVALNLAGVPYVDSAGLGEIVRCYTTLSRRNGKLKLLNLNKRITDLLTVTKLMSFFDSDDEGWPSGIGG